MTTVLQTAQDLLPTKVRETILLRAYAALKIPMIGYTRPVVEALDAEHCVVRIPLCRRTKNHVRSMYFGALAVGADVTGGMMAMYWTRQRKSGVVGVFKDLHADFLARPDGDVVFTCDEGRVIGELVDRAVASGERVELPIHVSARALAKGEQREVARFTMMLSIKNSTGKRREATQG